MFLVQSSCEKMRIWTRRVQRYAQINHINIHLAQLHYFPLLFHDHTIYPRRLHIYSTISIIKTVLNTHYKSDLHRDSKSCFGEWWEQRQRIFPNHILRRMFVLLIRKEIIQSRCGKFDERRFEHTVRRCQENVGRVHNI